MANNMKVKIVANTAIMVHNKLDPTEEEWTAWARELKRLPILPSGLLVVTDGGGPNATQRKEVNEVLNGRPLPTAVMSDSRVVRCIVTAFNWLGWKMNAFAPGNEVAALAWLGVDEGMAQQMIKEARAMKTALAEATAKAAPPPPPRADSVAR